MKRNESEPRYVISIAARMLGIQTYTLRYYERVGIIAPSRTQGNIRLYSERDIELLRRAKTLMEDLGINLAGVEVILRLSQRIDELRRRTEELESELRELRG
ncbi:MAG: MerR family transcriptional regulator [Dehalococcoidales bacterium]|nr:MerR family transcriptional regulator [Dehalococcoidales bacterium]